MSNPMIPRERSDYSAIVDRPPLKLPGKARIVFWTIVNYEVWDIGKPMARQLLPAPTGVPLMPDVVHWAFHEYGMRVGCWRFHELFTKLGIKPTLAANARICEDYPRVAEEARKDRRQRHHAGRREKHADERTQEHEQNHARLAHLQIIAPRRSADCRRYRFAHCPTPAR